MRRFPPSSLPRLLVDPPLSKGLWKGKSPESIWRKAASHDATLYLGRKAVERPERLRGVGRWTAEYVLLRGPGRWHLFPGDDVGASNASFRGYADDMQTGPFEENLQMLVDRASKERVVLMCAEALPWRCHRSGLYETAEGRVLIYIHKEQELNDVEGRYPAQHYVLVDDKLRILTAVKKA